MMLYPAMADLSKQIPNYYLMVNVVARRARQIAQTAEDEERRLTEKPVTSAIHEISAGEIAVKDVDIAI